MILDSKENALKDALSDFGGIYDEMAALGSVSSEEFSSDDSLLCIVDVVNGFLKFGGLADTSSCNVIPCIDRLAHTFAEMDIPIISINDGHDVSSPEFESFPVHCLYDGEEAKLVDELSWLFAYKNFYLKRKTSTNALFEETLMKTVLYRKNINNFIITGVCTDICILQLALALRTYGIVNGRSLRVIVPENCVDTYGGPLHSKQFINLTALKTMAVGGVEIVKEII